jgi:UDP-2,3-diacylglucosamine pyrophosphatase LpxH
LILVNRAINWILKSIGREKMSLSKKVKNSVKKAVSWIGDFEQTAAELAIENQYSTVICGHIHQPQIRTVETDKGSVVYMNSGDWIENLTSLEYSKGQWEIYQYDEKQVDESAVVIPIKHDKKIPVLDVLTDEVGVFFQSLTVASR